ILLVAVPNEGYAFECWSSSGGGDFADAGLSSTSFIMPAHDVTITAVFTKIEVPLAQAVNFEGDGPGSRSNGAVILIAIAVSLAVILAGILLALYRRSRRFLDDDAVVPEDSREALLDRVDTDVDFFGGGAAYDEPESDDGVFLNAHASFFDSFDDEPFDHGVDSDSSDSYAIETVDAFDDTGHEPSVFGAAELPEPEDVETSDGGDTNSSNADITESMDSFDDIVHELPSFGVAELPEPEAVDIGLNGFASLSSLESFDDLLLFCMQIDGDSPEEGELTHEDDNAEAHSDGV
ncbi:MAG: hypothetical protein FWE66_04475, partial [Oscillospiraceae bacterium]|nr:hypothetical protein [Oscillospiraceae bacterium]